MKNIIKKWWFWAIVCSAILIVIVLNMFLKPKFEITDFSITKDTTEYEYIDNYVSYSGKGIITTKDKNSIYVVILKEKLVSGGNTESDSKEERNSMVLVVNGKGEFSTYDYGDENKIKKPKYEFEVLGYIKVK